MIKAFSEKRLFKIAINALIFLCVIADAAILQAQVKIQKSNAQKNAGSFVHPGLMQNRQDLDFMKKKIFALSDN